MDATSAAFLAQLNAKTLRNRPPLAGSGWGRRAHRLTRALYPSTALETGRQFPIFSIRRGTKHSAAIAQRNAKRLDQLWQLSCAHGVSWDVIDAIYMLYIDTMNLHVQKFAECEYQLRMLAAAYGKRYARTAREAYLTEKNAELKRLQHADSDLLCPRSYRWNIARFIFHRWKRTYLSSFTTARLRQVLRAYATNAILLRENYERYHSLVDLEKINYDPTHPLEVPPQRASNVHTHTGSKNRRARTRVAAEQALQKPPSTAARWLSA